MTLGLVWWLNACILENAYVHVCVACWLPRPVPEELADGFEPFRRQFVLMGETLNGVWEAFEQHSAFGF